MKNIKIRLNDYTFKQMVEISDFMAIERLDGSYFVVKSRYERYLSYGSILDKGHFREVLNKCLRPVVLHEKYIDMENSKVIKNTRVK